MEQHDTFKRFVAFHEANPHVYAELVKLARTVKAAGYAHFGIRTIWERLRWMGEFEVEANSAYKLNDHYTGLYARLISEMEVDLTDFFHTRASERGSQDDLLIRHYIAAQGE
jgi:hypothetical protein